MEKLKLQRQWLKSGFSESDNITSDQEKKLPQPPLEKPYDENSQLIDLPEFDEKILSKTNIISIIKDRKSRRKYKEASITLEELSFLLWATQGVKRTMPNNYATIRNVPSAGARHPFETYLAVNRVQGLKPGVYKYIALKHKLLFLFEDEYLKEKISEAALDQPFVGNCAVTFIWSCVPYRSEWRYNILSHKVILLDAGHVCQNLYIACEAISCGTCAIGAYDQTYIDNFLGIDGENELVVYMAPVGKVGLNE